MEFLFFMAVIYLCMYFTRLLIGTMYEIKVSRYLKFLECLMVIISIVIITVCIKPDIDYDLSRHYETINFMRYYGFNYETNYENLFIVKFLFYLVSLFPYNELLPAISVTITYSTFLYITSNFIGKYNKGYKLVFFSWLIHISLLPFIVSYSGIRTSMAFAIFALAVYKDLIQKRKGVFTTFCYIMPLFIHPASTILLGLRILFISKNFFIAKLRYFLPFWSLFCYIFINLFNTIPIPYIRYTAQKLEYYFLNFSGDNRIYFVNLCFLIFMFLLFKLVIRRKKSTEPKNINQLINYIEIVIYFAIGSFYLPSVMVRLLYFIAFFSFPIIYLSMTKSSARERLVVIVVFFIFIIGSIMYQYVQLTTHQAYISFDFLKMN